MSANRKRALAILCGAVFSALVGIICAFTASALGVSPVGSLSAGGGAFVFLCTATVAAVGPFQFTDSRPTPPPAGPQQGTPTPTT